MNVNRILFIVGTRPELIKVFPIVNYLRKNGLDNYRLVSTGQHKDLLKKYWELFEITPDYELEIMTEGQDLSSLTSKAILEINELIKRIESEFNPSIILAQGDTITVMASSVVAFFNKIPYAHVEAGLRSFDMCHPFPEEFNRRVSSIVSEYNFAPTSLSMQNLLNEQVDESKIHVVGNTVIDTLNYFIDSGKLESHKLDEIKFKGVKENCVLITCHRRENHGKIDQLIEAISFLANENKATKFVWPVHPNPAVYNIVKDSDLKFMENVCILEPLEYLDLIKVISISKLVLTDSGGIQEEAPTFKVPVLVLRETTERPEAINIGVSKLTRMDTMSIIEDYNNFKPIFPANFVNPYGDGNASEKIVKIICK
jgi:UDP-N-acetylglucosamine 2-epimerase